MSVAFAQRVHPSFDDVGGRVHVGLADLEVDDVLPLALQSAGANQHFKGGFRSQPRHPPGQAQFGLGVSVSSSSHRQTE